MPAAPPPPRPRRHPHRRRQPTRRSTPRPSRHGRRSRLGARLVQVEVAAEESLTGTLALVRGRKTLATKRLARVPERDRVLTLVVAQRVAQGPATLRIALRDGAGNTLAATRTVRLPKR